MNKSKQNEIKSFPLSTKKLHKLCRKDSGIVLRKDCPCHIKLNYNALPVHSKNFKKCVAEVLNKRVLRYNSDLNDMILRICNIRVKQPIEASRLRRLNVTCIADVFVFKPQCGSVLTATVNKTSDSHIGCVMYDVFNVAIIKPTDLPYSKWPGKIYKIHDEVVFKVIKVDVSEVIPYIIGDLVIDEDKSNYHDEEHNNVISNDDNLIEPVKDVKSKKRKLETPTKPKSAKKIRLM